MRSKDDLVNVSFVMEGIVSLDWERIEQDPVWQMAARRHADRKACLADYVSRYLSNEAILTEAPATNGPASVTRVTTRIIEA